MLTKYKARFWVFLSSFCVLNRFKIGPKWFKIIIFLHFERIFNDLKTLSKIRFLVYEQGSKMRFQNKVTWVTTVASVFLKWCQTTEQSELMNANKGHIFNIISDSQKWLNSILLFIGQWSKFIKILNHSKINRFRVEIMTLTYSYFQVNNEYEHISTILWNLSRDIKNNHVVNFEWTVLDQFRENCLISLKIWNNFKNLKKLDDFDEKTC